MRELGGVWRDQVQDDGHDTARRVSPRASDLVGRRLRASRPSQLWVRRPSPAAAKPSSPGGAMATSLGRPAKRGSGSAFGRARKSSTVRGSGSGRRLRRVRGSWWSTRCAGVGGGAGVDSGGEVVVAVVDCGDLDAGVHCRLLRRRLRRRGARRARLCRVPIVVTPLAVRGRRVSCLRPLRAGRVRRPRRSPAGASALRG